jgi:hypothetical protein
VRNTPHRLRNKQEARAYVAGVVSNLLQAELMNGSAWLHMHSGGGEGNLANMASEKRAHQALGELMLILDAMEAHAESKGRKP